MDLGGLRDYLARQAVLSEHHFHHVVRDSLLASALQRAAGADRDHDARLLGPDRCVAQFGHRDDLLRLAQTQGCAERRPAAP